MTDVVSRRLGRSGTAGVLSERLSNALLGGAAMSAALEDVPLISTMAVEFYFLHEMAHVYLGHDKAATSEVSQRSRELEADTQAMEWLVRWRNPCPEAYAAIAVAIELAQLWETATVCSTTTHPTAEARLSGLLNNVDAEALSFARAVNRRVAELAESYNYQYPRGFCSPWVRLGNECLHLDTSARHRHFRSRAMYFLFASDPARYARSVAFYLSSNALDDHDDPEERDFAWMMRELVGSLLVWLEDQPGTAPAVARSVRRSIGSSRNAAP
jgi:hypothetical protein